MSNLFDISGGIGMNPMWWAVILMAALLVVLAVLIGFMLWSLARRGDERSALIKTKAMSAAFIGTVILLVLETMRRAASGEADTNPLLLLVLVAFIYWASLVFYKRKYGDLG